MRGWSYLSKIQQETAAEKLKKGFENEHFRDDIFGRGEKKDGRRLMRLEVTRGLQRQIGFG